MKFIYLSKACVLLWDLIQASLSNLTSACWRSRHISALCLPVYTKLISACILALVLECCFFLFMCEMVSSCYSGFSRKASSWERPSLATQSKAAASLSPNLSSARSCVLFLRISYHYQTLRPFKSLFFWAFLSLT